MYLLKLRNLVILLSICIAASCAKKNVEPFVGQITYKIVSTDTTYKDMIPEMKMVVYTNDTLVRIETSNPVFWSTSHHQTFRVEKILFDVVLQRNQIRNSNKSIK